MTMSQTVSPSEGGRWASRPPVLGACPVPACASEGCLCPSVCRSACPSPTPGSQVSPRVQHTEALASPAWVSSPEPSPPWARLGPSLPPGTPSLSSVKPEVGLAGSGSHCARSGWVRLPPPNSPVLCPASPTQPSPGPSAVPPHHCHLLGPQVHSTVTDVAWTVRHGHLCTPVLPTHTCSASSWSRTVRTPSVSPRTKGASPSLWT